VTATRAGLVVAVEDFETPDGRALVTELIAELDVRYEADDSVGTGNPELEGDWSVRPDQVRPPAGAFVVARLDGTPVGCGAVRPLPFGPPHVAEIKRMYTRPAARRRGVSRAVLAALEDRAAGLGYRRIQLVTGIRQPEAMALYEDVGYRPVAVFGPFAASDFVRCYSKDLAAHNPSSGPGGPERTYHSQP
jgi:GNAT superfamily N-acetyltransferase